MTHDGACAPASLDATRQQALLVAFSAASTNPDGLGLRERGERAARGLEAYRANAQAVADRALAAAFGTVQALVGAEDFSHIACEFWRAHPPTRGDMGEWGGAFPAFLAAHRALAAWPYLADCARLDLALHRNERAADAVLDAASLGLLESADPARLQLLLVPGCELLESAWPIATIHRAHHVAPDESDAAFAEVRGAIAQGRGEAVWVVREGWRATAQALDAPTCRWLRAVLAGASIDAALVAAGDDFEFAAWLTTALQHQWLQGLVILRD